MTIRQDAAPGCADHGFEEHGFEEYGFEEYVRTRRAALFAAAVGITRDRHAAEDLLQVALIRLYQSWDRVRDRAATDGYVRRIMINTYAGWWRRSARRGELVSDRVDGPAPGDPVAAALDRAEVLALVRGLPPRQRSVVVLRFLEERSEAETAQILGIAVGTVKSQSSRAVTSLRLAAAG